jgi:hypothetical protein
MKIRSIHIYSHDGRRRDLQFKVNGLNVITAERVNKFETGCVRV